jgi:hypothetical protein
MMIDWGYIIELIRRIFYSRQYLVMTDPLIWDDDPTYEEDNLLYIYECVLDMIQQPNDFLLSSVTLTIDGTPLVINGEGGFEIRGHTLTAYEVCRAMLESKSMRLSGVHKIIDEFDYDFEDDNLYELYDYINKN